MPELPIDRLITTIRDFKLGHIHGAGYIPLFKRNELTDKLQELSQICIDTRIVKQKTLNAIYRRMLK